MGLFALIIIFVALVIILIAGLVVVGLLRTRGQVERALNTSLLLIKVTRENQSQSSDSGQSEKKSNKDLISISEQMFSAFSNIHAKGWNKFIHGEPYLALEVAVHHIGEESHFYISVPLSSEDVIEKQIYAHYPTAEITKVKDYNIFNPEGFVAGSYLAYSTNQFLPFKTYQKLEADPMSGILTSMSKLQREGEGVALQILIRPSHASSQKTLATKIAREMQAGYQLKEAIQRAKHPPKPQKPDPGKPSELIKVITPTDDEIIKGLTTKSGKQNFDVNVRLVTSAPTIERAQQILGDFEGSFVQLAHPDMNSLKPVKLSGRSLEKLIYNYSFRLFDNRQKLVMSTEEVASIYHFPLSTTSAPNVAFLKSKLSEPPANLPQEGIVIGKNIFRGEEKTVRMLDGDRRRHLYIIGQTGTGKTSLMK